MTTSSRMLDATFLVNTPDLSQRGLYRGATCIVALMVANIPAGRAGSMADDQSPDTGPKSGEGLEKVRSGEELFMQSFEPLAAGPHLSQRRPTRIVPEMYRASAIPTNINSMIE